MTLTLLHFLARLLRDVPQTIPETRIGEPSRFTMRRFNLPALKLDLPIVLLGSLFFGSLAILPSPRVLFALHILHIRS